MRRRSKDLLKRARGDDALRRALTDLRHDLQQIDHARPFEAASPEVRHLFDDPLPWMVPEAVKCATEALDETMTGLEWGGGASTPYWCRQLGVLHTLEASPGWALVLLDYMTHQLDLVDRWRFHFVGANWPSTNSRRRRTGRALPPPDVRRSLEDDYALMLPDRVDAIFLDGAVRQKTSARLGEYIERDRPAVIVVDNLEEAYVNRSLPFDALVSYEEHAFWGQKPSRDGNSSVPHGTTVWLR